MNYFKQVSAYLFLIERSKLIAADHKEYAEDNTLELPEFGVYN